MSSMKQEAVRMATALDDYEHLRVVGLRAVDARGAEIEIRDERAGLHYTIGSHADYWDFLGYFVMGKQWPVKPLTAAAVA
jgi:hypothetical protein